MKKLFSYCLFEPKTMPSHRDWDKHKTNKDRYWYNIPTILLLNKLLYKEYTTRFFLSENIWKNPLSKIFKIFNDAEYQTIKIDYLLTEPAIWRMNPLWEFDVSIFHTRDVDSITSEQEYKFLKAFELSSCCVGTIRSHEDHTETCKMLAGLSSFKPELISSDIKGINFNFYYSNKKNVYGSDQELLNKYFTENPHFTKNNFLDCKIDRQFNEQNFPCVKADLSSIDVEQQKKEIFDIIKKYTNCSWLGEPCDSRGELLDFLLEQNLEIKQRILEDKQLAKFYMVK